MKIIKQASPWLAALCLPLSTHAQAQSATPLEPVVVTANRIAVPGPEALASVTVLERSDIEASQAPDLIDLLGRQAGIDVARTGGAGQASTVFMRGSNSSHTLVLIDGIRVNAATQGVMDLAHLPLAQIERIEIVRGPRAALWGSDAIGGVIHIFTRDPRRAFLQAQAGSYGRAGATAGAGFGNDDHRLGIAAGGEDLRGFSATNENVSFGHDPDADGYRNRNLSLRGRTLLGSQLLAFSGLATDADVQFDQGDTAAQNRVAGLALSGPIRGLWSHSLSVGHSSEDLNTPVYLSRFGSTRDSVDWINVIEPASKHRISLGLGWSRESGYSRESGSGFEAARRNSAVFGAWRGQFGLHTTELSLRHDRNSQFDGATTGNAAWGWQVNPAWRLRASWGQGFRAPNFNELYYPGFFGLFQGNPALQPERSSSSELGVDWQVSPGQHWGLSAYRTRVVDLIAFQGPSFSAVNVNRAAIDGVELSYGHARGPWTLDANATWLDARDQATNAPLLRRADRKFNVALGRSFANGALLAIDATAVSRRPDAGGVELGGYGRIDLRASAPLSDGWLFEARLENIGDRDYELVEGYNTPGRSGTLALRWESNAGS